jgi:pro-apoptotic serine protease NMA111
VEYLHPTLGVAFISWDPKLLGDTQARSVRLATDFIKQGADVTFVGFSHNQRLVTSKTSVVDVIDITVS